MYTLRLYCLVDPVLGAGDVQRHLWMSLTVSQGRLIEVAREAQGQCHRQSRLTEVAREAQEVGGGWRLPLAQMGHGRA